MNTYKWLSERAKELGLFFLGGISVKTVYSGEWSLVFLALFIYLWFTGVSYILAVKAHEEDENVDDK